jgi:hypothetical protein
MNTKYENVLNKALDWDVVQTSVAGIQLQRMPESKTAKARLFATINPVDKKTGMVTKKRGYVIRDTNELKALREVLANPKLDALVKELEEQFGKATGTQQGAIEI